MKKILLILTALLIPVSTWAAALVIPDRSTDLRDMPAAVCTDQYLKGSAGSYVCADAATAETDPVYTAAIAPVEVSTTPYTVLAGNVNKVHKIADLPVIIDLPMTGFVAGDRLTFISQGAQGNVHTFVSEGGTQYIKTGTGDTLSFVTPGDPGESYVFQFTDQWVIIDAFDLKYAYQSDKHTQGTDLGLDTGGTNPVTAETITGHIASTSVHLAARDDIASVHIGHDAGKVSTGYYNVFVGYDTGLNNTIGNNSVGVGYNCLKSNTVGIDNTAIGWEVLKANTEGRGNVGLGWGVLHENTIGQLNIAMGDTAMYEHISGNDNIAIGAQSLGSDLTGHSNVAIGSNALLYGSAKQENVAIGFNTGMKFYTGNNCVFIGKDAGSNNNQKADAVNSLALGSGTYTTKDNQVVLGNDSINETLLKGNIGINTTSFGTNATKTIGISTGVAPTSSPADIFQLYSADISAGNAAPHFRTENGTVIKLDQPIDTTAAPVFSAANMTSFPTLNQDTSGTAANLSGTPALPNGTSATTQAQADNTTKIATTAYVDTGLATITAGNGYMQHVSFSPTSPADSATLYFSHINWPLLSSATLFRVPVIKAGTIKAVSIFTYANATAGSGENISMYIRVNNTTDTLIATVGSATAERIFSNTDLSIPVSVGDFFNIKMVNPAWATNPTAVFGSGSIYIE
ncbi:MAG: hypothetical protein HZB62_10760 [Nitrospirae bacterium]|nr:hypothetical protein [Nitrospirota bacterium]